GECLDHQRERAIEYGVGGDELTPVGPWRVQVRDAGKIALVAGAVGGSQLAQRPIEDPTVADVVEPHGRGRDVCLQTGRRGAPFRVAHPEQLLVVGEALDQRVETHLSGSPGPQSLMTASRGTIIISTQRSSS